MTTLILSAIALSVSCLSLGIAIGTRIGITIADRMDNKPSVDPEQFEARKDELRRLLLTGGVNIEINDYATRRLRMLEYSTRNTKREAQL